ncbi:hypothetical protein DSM104443_01558 [Usitatibacter rugosus]|uniref:GIY-YIG domain-containing protein n=1 Tax=Usitatibacter rugosus TaxID=2732067 RepID=A0A6M4GVJ5_9PROT|nr:hypothetical protein DSM104443_01558 [Usitatibacter rugosus]
MPQLGTEQGVYGLYRSGSLVYVGKADNLRTRLDDHRCKISGRKNIHLDEMTFSALYVSANWTALAPETSLIRHFRRAGLCEWNGNGFGPHDPGRHRELTDKRPDGFDMQYPIVDEWAVAEVKAGRYSALDLLVLLKQSLPYLLRYEVEEADGKKGSYRKGHTAYRDVFVEVSGDAMSARDLLKLVADQLKWQATVFPSHMILYNETHRYKFGKTL